MTGRGSNALASRAANVLGPGRRDLDALFGGATPDRIVREAHRMMIEALHVRTVAAMPGRPWSRPPLVLEPPRCAVSAFALEAAKCW